jgi:hypothetical protein
LYSLPSLGACRAACSLSRRVRVRVEHLREFVGGFLEPAELKLRLCFPDPGVNVAGRQREVLFQRPSSGGKITQIKVRFRQDTERVGVPGSARQHVPEVADRLSLSAAADLEPGAIRERLRIGGPVARLALNAAISRSRRAPGSSVSPTTRTDRIGAMRAPGESTSGGYGG